eukprot:scaffold17428_cov39-Phaeocystis_antarctica.AAC.3
MPPYATAGETTSRYRCTAGSYRATGGDAPVLRAPVVGARRVVRTPVVGAWIGVGIGFRGHMARSEIRIVWRWDRSESLVCGAGERGLGAWVWARVGLRGVGVGVGVGAGLALGV